MHKLTKKELNNILEDGWKSMLLVFKIKNKKEKQ